MRNRPLGEQENRPLVEHEKPALWRTGETGPW